MIKTFIATTVDELDNCVNKFMREKKQNLPVRDGQMFVQDKMVFKAMVFYNEDFKEQIPSIEGPEEVDATPKYDEDVEQAKNEIAFEGENKKKEERGALWQQDGGKITGTWKTQRITLPEAMKEKLIANGSIDITIKNEVVHVMKNKFKNKPKSPDYVILPKRK